MSFAYGTMSTNSDIKQDVLCTGFHSSLLRARPALKLRTLRKQNDAARTGVNGYKTQVNCQHGRQIVRRSSPTLTPEVCAEDDTLKPVPAWQKLASFLLKSTAVVALALALVSPHSTDRPILSGTSFFQTSEHHVHVCFRRLARFRLLRLLEVEVAWEAQASVLPGQVVAHIAGKP